MDTVKLTLPDRVCVIAIEFEAFPMHERTRAQHVSLVNAIHDAFDSSLTGVLQELERR